jgi:hypothetical protein
MCCLFDRKPLGPALCSAASTSISTSDC